MSYPLIEQYRAELRAMDYRRLTGPELAEAMRRMRNGKASNAIEGNYGSDDCDEFLSMLLEEGVPPEIGNGFVLRFLQALATEQTGLLKAS